MFKPSQVMRALLSIIFVITSIPAIPAQPEKLKTVEHASQSRNTLVRLMKNPYASEAYRSLQYRFLSTVADQEMRNFLSSNLATAMIFQALDSVQESIVSDFTKSVALNASNTTDKSSPKRRIIRQMLENTAIDFGSTEQAIANSKVIIMKGPVNAYTMSGSDKSAAMAIYDGLLNEMTPKEVQGVIGHEFGHIRSKHVSMGILTNLLMIIGRILLSEGIEGLKLAQAEVMAQEMLRNPNLFCQSKNHVHQHAHATMIKLFEPTESEQKLNKIVAQTLMLPPQVLATTVAEFFMLISKLSENGNLFLPVKTKQYVKDLLQIMKNTGWTVHIKQEDFSVHAAVIYNALSREKETSADNFAGAIMPNEILASIFAKFMAEDITAKNRKEVFAEIQQQVHDFFASATAADVERHNSGSHPEPALRVMNVLMIPKYPNVAIANPFQRLFLIRDQAKLIAMQRAQLAKRLEIEANEIAALQDLPEEMRKQASDQMIETALKNMVDADEFNKVVPLIENEIVNLITHLNLTDKEASPGLAQRNPRMENTIQLLAFQKEVNIFALRLMQKDLEEVNSPAQKQEIATAMLALDDSVRNTDPIVAELLRQIDALLTTTHKGDVTLTNYKALLEELNGVDSMEKGEALRAKITNFNKRTSLPNSVDPDRCEQYLKLKPS